MRATVILLLVASPAAADGGLLRFSKGGISVFTSPTPAGVGALDVSVLVQDGKGKVRLGVPVEVRAWPIDAPQRALRAAASGDLATNKLMQSAHLILDRPGRWRLAVVVEGAEYLCDLEITDAPPSWRWLAPWVGWPFVVVALFLLKNILTRREPPAAPRL